MRPKLRRIKQSVRTCEHNDDDGFPDCSNEAAFRHPDRDGDFFYCVEHKETCPLCVPLEKK